MPDDDKPYSIGERHVNDDILKIRIALEQHRADSLLNILACMSSEHFGQLAWQFKRMSGSSGLKVQAAIAC